GIAAWRAVRAVQVEQTSVTTQKGESIAAASLTTWKFPNRIVSVRRMPFGESRLGFDGTRGWSSFRDEVKPEPDLERFTRGEWERSFFHLFGSPDSVSIRAAANDVTVDGANYHVANVASDAVSAFTLYFANDGAL